MIQPRFLAIYRLPGAGGLLPTNYSRKLGPRIHLKCPNACGIRSQAWLDRPIIVDRGGLNSILKYSGDAGFHEPKIMHGTGWRNAYHRRSVIEAIGLGIVH